MMLWDPTDWLKRDKKDKIFMIYDTDAWCRKDIFRLSSDQSLGRLICHEYIEIVIYIAANHRLFVKANSADEIRWNYYSSK